MVFLKNALMCNLKKSQINLTNAVCLNNASSFFSLICANAFYFHALSLFISFFLFASITVLLICLFFLIICSHRCFFLFFFV